MVASIMGPIGGGAGYVIYMFFGINETEPNTELTKNNIFRMCWGCAIFLTLLYLLIIFLIKEKPSIPPTKSASVESTEPIFTSLKQLFTNCNFIFVMNSFALVYACLTTFSQEVSLVVSPYFGDQVVYMA